MGLFSRKNKQSNQPVKGAPELPDELIVKSSEEVEQEPAPEPDQPTGVDASNTQLKPAKQHPKWQKPFRVAVHWLIKHKLVTSLLLVVLIFGAIAAVPYTRFKIASNFLRQSVTLRYLESTSNKPVSNIEVVIGDVSGKTDVHGEVTLRPKVGNQQATAKKQYFADSQQNVLVPIGKQKQTEVISIKATGRQVPVTIIDAISGKALADVTVAAVGAETKTDAKGEVVLVLPADKETVDVSVSNGGYVTLAGLVKVTESVAKENTLSLVPDLYVYFLSNREGTIDVVKARLDGSDRKVVLAGTGRERNWTTTMISSYDWRYIALLSGRDGGDLPRLFVLDTQTGSLITAESNEANIEVVGWSGSNFVYQTTMDVNFGTADRQMVKMFDAESKKTSIIARSMGSQDDGYGAENFGPVMLVGSDVLFSKTINNLHGNAWKAAVVTVKVNGDNLRTLKEWEAPYASMARSGPNTVRFAVPKENDPALYEFKNGAVSTVSGRTATEVYSSEYLNYISSPSGLEVVWDAMRDSHSVVSSFDFSDGTEKKVANLDYGFNIYGWVTDKYLVVHKDNVIYSISSDKNQQSVNPVAVGGYHGDIGNGLLYGARNY